MGDNGSGGYYGYRASKAALNAFGKSLAVDLKIVALRLHKFTQVSCKRAW